MSAAELGHNEVLDFAPSDAATRSGSASGSADATQNKEKDGRIQIKGVARPRDEIWNVGAHINVAAISELVEVRATAAAAASASAPAAQKESAGEIAINFPVAEGAATGASTPQQQQQQTDGDSSSGGAHDNCLSVGVLDAHNRGLPD